MPNIKAIGFDYGGVIGGGPGVGKQFTAELCALLNITKEQYRSVYFGMNHLLNTGKLRSWKEFWRLFLLELHIFSEQNWSSLMALSDTYAARYIETDQKVIDLIDQLRAVGYKVGLLSNATLENAVQMRAIQLDQHFDAFLISAEVGLQKPDPKAFALLAERLGVQLSELAFIDDATRSLSTAETCGFTPILFTSYEALVEKLSELEVFNLTK